MHAQVQVGTYPSLAPSSLGTANRKVSDLFWTFTIMRLCYYLLETARSSCRITFQVASLYTTIHTSKCHMLSGVHLLDSLDKSNQPCHNIKSPCLAPRTLTQSNFPTPIKDTCEYTTNLMVSKLSGSHVILRVMAGLSEEKGLLLDRPNLALGLLQQDG